MPVAKKPESLAVLIAKDVLKRLKFLKVLASNTYIQGKHGILADRGKENAQKLLPALEKCNVCAIGACMLSYIRLKNEVTAEQLDAMYGSDMADRMHEAFPDLEMRKIETAFENSYDLMTHTRIDNFPEDDKERLKVIMENIVKNKGTFVAPKA